MRTRLVSLILLAGFSSYCSISTDVEIGDSGVVGGELSPTDFSTWLVRPGSDPIPTLRAAGGVGKIIVDGAIGTPYPCYDFKASVDSRAGEVSLDIVAARKPVPCIAVVATFAYEAVVHEVAPGPYTVLVTHVLDDHRTQVLESVVQVH